MKKLLYSLLLLSSACSFNKSAENQTMRGHEKLYSEPDTPLLAEVPPPLKRVVIASTNDLHGSYWPQQLTFNDEHQKELQSTTIGGVDVINSYFKILRETYQNVVLVDSGDILANAESLDTTREFFSFLKYDALTVGLRDFNLKVPAQIGRSSDLFQKFSEKSKVPLLISNLYDLKTARGVEWKGTKSHHIQDIDGVRVGIIGLIPDDIVGQTPVNNRVGLFVESMLQSTLRHARLLRSLGADMIVVLTHQGLDCSSELMGKKKLPINKVNFDPRREGTCDTTSILGQYLDRLPPQLVDVVIGGRVANKMANYVNGTLVMSGFHDGKSFSYAEFFVDTKASKIVPEKTVVHQPVLFCHEFFKETNDCFPEDTSVDHRARIPATFLGKPIERDLTLEKKFPGITKGKSAFTKSQIDVQRSLTAFKADISFLPETSGESQLYLMFLKGRELAQLLEEEYNLNRKDSWRPSPFKLKRRELTFQLAGQELQLEKEYGLLTDLESLQKHPTLLKLFRTSKSESLANHSWSSLPNEDAIASNLAAPTR